MGSEENILSIEQKYFGCINSQNIYEYHLSNGEIDVNAINYGCIITSIETPDKFRNKQNIVAGFYNLDQYLDAHPYFGAVIGRYANRIANGKFNIDGTVYSLQTNDGINHLHGGVSGFDKKVWQLDKIINNNNEVGVLFSYFSKNNEEGYPGDLEVKVSYILTIKNELILHYEAITDRPTIINLTNHSYFNLTGFDEPDIYDHQLQIFADGYTMRDKNSISNGEIHSVKNTPLDFSQPKKIGKHIHLLHAERGYDHNYVLKNDNKGVMLAAELRELKSARSLKVFTDQPGLQLYTANWFDGSLQNSNGVIFQKHGAVALETQAFPDSPNHPNFPSTILRPKETYSTTTIYQF